MITGSHHQGRFLLALSLAAGCVDAVSYLGLGKVFTANMTGNTVLLAVAVATGKGADALHSLAALGGFVLGAAWAVVLTGRGSGGWPAGSRAVFALETVALALVLILWAAVGVGSARYGLILLAGLAMGAQSAAVRDSDVSGVNTTFMTGTLLNAVVRVVLRVRSDPARPAGSMLPAAAWAIYAVGALIGGVCERFIHAASVALPLAIVGALTLLAFTAKETSPAGS